MTPTTYWTTNTLLNHHYTPSHNTTYTPITSTHPARRSCCHRSGSSGTCGAEESLTTLSSYIVSQINSSYDNVLAAVEPLGGGISIRNSNDDPDRKQFLSADACFNGNFKENLENIFLVASSLNY